MNDIKKPECPYFVTVDRLDRHSVVHIHERINDRVREIGHYSRDYGAFGEDTFSPFQHGGKWYALVSRQYECIELMSLPDCKVLCTESGFCPVEIWNPSYKEVIQKSKKNQFKYTFFEGDRRLEQYHARLNNGKYEISISPWIWTSFAFVAGCVFGDDSSWKVMYIDLSRVAEGVISIDDRFNYFELPDGLDLRQAIHLRKDFNYISANVSRNVFYHCIDAGIEKFRKSNEDLKEIELI